MIIIHTLLVEVHTWFGVTVFDEKDDNVSVVTDIGNITTTLLGTYSVVYNATDKYGNNAVEKYRTVIVRDTTAPEITLNGNSLVTIEYTASYTEQGANAIDLADPNVIVNIDNGNLDDNVLGNYTITYTASDALIIKTPK